MPLHRHVNNDDQLILNYVVKKEIDFFNKNVGCDINKEIFFVTTTDDMLTIKYLFKKQIPKLTLKNNKLYNSNNSTISVLHLAANVDANYYLKKMGYKVKKLKINNYKFKQAYDLIKIFIKKYIYDIILIIIILYNILKKNKSKIKISK